MFDTIEAKRTKHELLAKQRRMLDVAEREQRGLKAHEQTEYKRLDLQIEDLDQKILDAEADQERRRKLAEKELGKMGGTRDINPEQEFRNIGEYFHAITRARADGIRDPRLDILAETRAQSMGTGSEGGYAVPTVFDKTLRAVMAQEGVVRSRATVIPAGYPPDAKLDFPALDQTSGSNTYGGVVITHTGEAITMTETSFNLRQVTLEPKELSAYIVVTNKLLNNWESCGTLIARLLSSAMIGAEDYDFLRGDGINKALGVINSPATITVGRSGAGAIAYTDAAAMAARLLRRGGAPCWLASQTIIPQLCAMVDAGGHSVWSGSRADALPGAAGPLPTTLLGYPLIFSDRLPALGTSGDLLLTDLSYYLIKDGSGPAIASSEAVYFLSNRTVFRIVWNVDARPWLTEAIGLEGATTSTVSPFVMLS